MVCTKQEISNKRWQQKALANAVALVFKLRLGKIVSGAVRCGRLAYIWMQQHLFKWRYCV